MGLGEVGCSGGAWAWMAVGTGACSLEGSDCDMAAEQTVSQLSISKVRLPRSSGRCECELEVAYLSKRYYCYYCRAKAVQRQRNREGSGLRELLSASSRAPSQYSPTSSSHPSHRAITSHQPRNLPREGSARAQDAPGDCLTSPDPRPAISPPPALSIISYSRDSPLRRKARGCCMATSARPDGPSAVVPARFQ